MGGTANIGGNCSIHGDADELDGGVLRCARPSNIVRREERDGRHDGSQKQRNCHGEDGIYSVPAAVASGDEIRGNGRRNSL